MTKPDPPSQAELLSQQQQKANQLEQDELLARQLQNEELVEPFYQDIADKKKKRTMHATRPGAVSTSRDGPSPRYPVEVSELQEIPIPPRILQARQRRKGKKYDSPHVEDEDIQQDEEDSNLSSQDASEDATPDPEDVGGIRNTLPTQEEPTQLLEADLVHDHNNAPEQVPRDDIQVATISDAELLTPARKRRVRWIVGILILVVCACVAAVLIVALKKDNDEQASTIIVRLERMTVVIQLDHKPEETGWSLDCGGETAIEFPTGFCSGRANELILHTESIQYEDQCTFAITDSGGDGIENGYFQMYKGNNISDPNAFIVEGSGFTDGASTTFRLQTASSTPAPPTTTTIASSMAPTVPRTSIATNSTSPSAAPAVEAPSNSSPGPDNIPLPSKLPTKEATIVLSVSPTTADPTTLQPTGRLPTTPGPTLRPSPSPTTPEPTLQPTTPMPTLRPSPSPTISTPQPSHFPTKNPTANPSRRPTPSPTPEPTRTPTPDPTPEPTRLPTPDPTPAPTDCIPCEWGEWSDWDECSDICGGVRSRDRDCDCPFPSCNSGCTGQSTETEACPPGTAEEIRFKSYESDENSWMGYWLYAIPSDVRAEDASYTTWKYCSKMLQDQSTKQCLRRFCCGDNSNDEDVELAPCSAGSRSQEWELISVGNSFYQIRNEEKDCCLDIYAGDSGPGKDVDCIDCDSSEEDQLWSLY